MHNQNLKFTGRPPTLLSKCSADTRTSGCFTLWSATGFWRSKLPAAPAGGVRDGVRQGPFGGCSCNTPLRHTRNCRKNRNGGVATPWSVTGGGGGWSVCKVFFRGRHVPGRKPHCKVTCLPNPKPLSRAVPKAVCVGNRAHPAGHLVIFYNFPTNVAPFIGTVETTVHKISATSRNTVCNVSVSSWPPAGFSMAGIMCAYVWSWQDQKKETARISTVVMKTCFFPEATKKERVAPVRCQFVLETARQVPAFGLDGF